MSQNPEKNITAEKIMEALAKERAQKPPRFCEDDSKIVIHGNNIKAYIMDLDIPYRLELGARLEKIKSKILEFTADDAGNIEFFINIFGRYVKYNCEEKCFYIWTGRCWIPDIKKTVQLWVQTAMKTRRDCTLQALGSKENKNKSKTLVRYVQKCCNQTSIRAIMEGLESVLACNTSIFDTRPYLINVLNGTIDLRTGKMKEHDYRDYISKLIPVVYDPESKAPKFEEFLKDTFKEKELIKYIKRFLGYCLTGETKEQLIHLCVGCGANGKSTLISLMRYIMSDYATVIPSKVLTSVERAGAPNSEIAQLPHKRLVCCSELNCTDVLNEGKIKIMSSGETLSARQLYKMAFTFDPEFKLLIDTNYLPIITGTDHGIWRRIRVIPFDHTINKNKINKDLLDELKKERRGVLAGLVKSATKYYSEGLDTCEIVEKATKKYRKSQDTLGSFIEACIKKEKGEEVRARILYEAYVDFCSDNFLNPMSETKFGKDFAARGYKRGKDKISRKYLDIKLK